VPPAVPAGPPSSVRMRGLYACPGPRVCHDSRAHGVRRRCDPAHRRRVMEPPLIAAPDRNKSGTVGTFQIARRWICAIEFERAASACHCGICGLRHDAGFGIGVETKRVHSMRRRLRDCARRCIRSRRGACAKAACLPCRFPVLSMPACTCDAAAGERQELRRMATNWRIHADRKTTSPVHANGKE